MNNNWDQTKSIYNNSVSKSVYFKLGDKKKLFNSLQIKKLNKKIEKIIFILGTHKIYKTAPNLFKNKTNILYRE
jgi:hypothetical protein